MKKYPGLTCHLAVHQPTCEWYMGNVRRGRRETQASWGGRVSRAWSQGPWLGVRRAWPPLRPHQGCSIGDNQPMADTWGGGRWGGKKRIVVWCLSGGGGGTDTLARYPVLCEVCVTHQCSPCWKNTPLFDDFCLKKTPISRKNADF